MAHYELLLGNGCLSGLGPCLVAFSFHFGLVGLHFLAFWPFRPPSFPCILTLWAFISLHFGLVGLHFLAFWPCGPSFPFILAFSGSASGVPPTSCQKWPVCPTSLQWIYQRRDRLHFAVFSLLGLHFLAFWPCRPSFPCILALWAFISLHFGLVGLHFLAFWPCGPSFPCILALWAFISFHFGFFGVSFWGASPRVAKNGPFAQRPYNGFISAVTGSILKFLAFWAFISLHFGLVGLHFLAFWPPGPSFPCILAFWAFISLHFGLVGLHFLAFWPCGPSFPCILAFSGSASGPPPTSCQKLPVCPTSLQWIYQRRDRLHFAVFNLAFLALWAFISLHFGLVGLHFLAFWPCGPSFPCILALWAFISLHFGLVGFHFLAFWPFRGQLPGPPPTSCQKWPVCPTSLQWIYQRRDHPSFLLFGPSFPCILASEPSSSLMRPVRLTL